MVKVSLQRYKNIEYHVHPIHKVFVSFFFFFFFFFFWGGGGGLGVHVKTKQKTRSLYKILFSNRLYMFSISSQQVHNITCAPVNAKQGLCRLFVTSMSENYFM